MRVPDQSDGPEQVEGQCPAVFAHQPARGGQCDTVPSEIALMMSAVARDRRSGGTQREIMLMEAGNTAASRARARCEPRSARRATSLRQEGECRPCDHQSTATPRTSQPP